MTEPVQLSLKFTNRPHLVPIDQATVYDIPTMLVELATDIKQGGRGNVVDAVVILRDKQPSGKYFVEGVCYGPGGNRSDCILMCESMKLQLMGVDHGATK